MKRILISIATGLIVGSFIYAIIVKSSYDLLVQNYKRATFFDALIENDPALAGLSQNSTYTPYVDIEFNWRLMRSAGIVGEDDLKNDLSCLISASLNKVLESKKDSLFNLRTLQYYCEIASKIGEDHNGSNSSKKKEIVDIIAKSLANYPKSLQYFQSSITKGSNEISLPGLSYFLFPWNSSVSRNTPVREVISNTFSLYQISFPELEKKYNLRDDNAGNCQQGLEEYRQVKELLTFLLVSANNNPQVEKAKMRLVVWEGPIQWIMIMLSITGLMLLVFRTTIKEKTDAVPLKNTYRWIIGTLPVFGFIGTILGLMFALRDADSIPLANGDFDTSIAISNITETLSTAFTTTLMAFILGVVLSLINLSLSYFFPSVGIINDNDDE